MLFDSNSYFSSLDVFRVLVCLVLLRFWLHLFVSRYLSEITVTGERFRPVKYVEIVSLETGLIRSSRLVDAP